MKRYRVSEGLWPYIRRSLRRSYTRFTTEVDESGQRYCKTNVSSDTFHRIVQRAKCQKKTDETGVFWVTAREANNIVVLTTLLEDAGVSSYQVIDDMDGSRRAHWL